MTQENDTISIEGPIDLYEGIVSAPPALVVVYGRTLGKAYYLQQSEQIIGRAVTSDIHIDEDSISRKHARITVDQNVTAVIDLVSTNGIFVNGHRVAQVNLQDGDRLQIGETVFKYLSGTNAESKFHDDIYRLMTVDDLTQTFNRQYFHESLKRELSRALRYRRNLSLAMLDIDSFKKINDTYGHLAGDEVLKTFSNLVGRNIRQSDLMARYGGDEFAIIIPEADPAAALKCCEKLRVIVGSHSFSFQEQTMAVTTSIGLQSYQHTVGELTISQLVAAADARLYEAKQAGRNRISSGVLS